jgi:hypothetical protein
VISNSEIKNNNQSDRAYSAAVKALRPKGGPSGQGIIIPKVSLKKKAGGQVNVQSLLGFKASSSGVAANFRTIQGKNTSQTS